MIRAMPRIKAGYWNFYVDGREERVTKYKRDIDVEGLVKPIMASDDPMHAIVMAECKRVCEPMRSAREQRKWASDKATEEAIAEAGGDADAAYAAWCLGRIDELAMAVERNVIDELCQDDGDDDDDDDSDDSDDEDED